MHHHFEFPLEEPVAIFTVVLFAILIAPVICRMIRVPQIIGLIAAGIALGPHGFGVLARDQSIILFGTVGLLYIMFLAGLEIDLNDFKKNRAKSLVFGALTFFFPMLLGTIAGRYILGYSWTTTLLLASMIASHTLLAYPTASRLGITKTRSVNIAVGGTIITDTAALLVLAVIAGSVSGELNAAFWIGLAVSFSLFSAVVLLVFPIFSRWFFKSFDDPVLHYTFVLGIVFLSALLAEIAGVEAIIGAFFGGLALNRLIPYTSPLMNRVEFVGNSIFIPFFLLSVGMLVDLRVLTRGPEALIVAVTMVVTVHLAKYLAAWVFQKMHGFSSAERQVIFGLSVAQAAATLAVVLVGFELGIFDENVMNGAVATILVSCIVSSFVVERSGQVLAMDEEVPTGSELEEDRILVPISNPATIESLVDLAAVTRSPKAVSPIYALAVVQDNEEVEERMRSARKMLEKATIYASGGDHKVQIVPRVDINVRNGILHAARELQTNQILMGWNAQPSTKDRLFGTILDGLLEDGPQMIIVSRVIQPLNTIERILLAVPPRAEREPGFGNWVKTIRQTAIGLGSKVIVFLPESGEVEFQEALGSNVETEYRRFDDWDDFLILSREIKDNDLFVVVSARPNTVSYSKIHASIPKYLSKYNSKDNFLVLYPELAQEVQDTLVRVD